MGQASVVSRAQVRITGLSFVVLLTLGVASMFMGPRHEGYMALKDVSLMPRWSTVTTMFLLLGALLSGFAFASMTKRSPGIVVAIVVFALIASFGARAFVGALG